MYEEAWEEGERDGKRAYKSGTRIKETIVVRKGERGRRKGQGIGGVGRKGEREVVAICT